MVGGDCGATGRAYSRMHRRSGRQPPGRYQHTVPDRLALGLYIDHLGAASARGGPGQTASVRRLTTAFRVERSLGQEDIGLPRGPRNREDLGDHGVGFQPVIADKARGGPGRRRLEGPGYTPATGALPFHEGLDGATLDGDASLRSELDRELDGKAQRVVQVKDFLRIDLASLQKRFQALGALAQGSFEPFLLQAKRF